MMGWQTSSTWRELVTESSSHENIVITSCEIGSFYEEGGDRCKLDIVSGCMDPTSHMFDPLAVVDDGTCPLDSDSEE